MRARNLKPGFFKNEDLVELPPLARILFVGLWCMADREGRLEDRPRRIKIEVLPYDDCDVDDLLDALEGRNFILRYQAEGKSCIQVVNFLKHQQPHYKEAASELPAADGWTDSLYPGGSIPPETRRRVMDRDQGRCQSCGATANLTLDHIIPQSKGGTHDEANLRVLCRSCNSSKNNRLAASEAESTSVQARSDVGANKMHHDTLNPESPFSESPSLNPESPSRGVGGDAATIEPVTELVGDFHTLCPSLPRVRQLTDSRKKRLAKAAAELGTEGLRDFFRRVEASDFLSGRKTDWRADLDWILKPEHVTKILEGSYDNRNGPTKTQANVSKAMALVNQAEREEAMREAV